MTAESNKEAWNPGAYYPLGFIGYPQMLGGLEMPLQGVSFCPPRPSSLPLPTLMHAPQNRPSTILIPLPNTPIEEAVHEDQSVSKSKGRKTENSGSDDEVSEPQSEEDSLSINRNPGIDTRLKLILHEATVLFKEELKLNEKILAKVKFKTKWQATVADLILLGDRSEEDGGFANIIEETKQTINSKSATRASWITLGHCCLLDNNSHEAYDYYKKGFFQDNKCLDEELWYITGIIFNAVSLFLYLR
jgi:hypothetical protein